MKNKKIAALILSIFMAFNTVACTNTTASTSTNNQAATSQVSQINIKEIPKKNNSLTEKQVFENMKQALEKLKSATATYKVKVSKIDSARKESPTNNIEIKSKIIYTDKKDKDGFKEIMQMYDETNIDGVKSRGYVNMENKKIYLEQDGKGLKEYKGEELTPQTESSYATIIKMLMLSTTLASDKKMKMTETDTTYNFSYKGKNGELLYMVDGLFGLSTELMSLEKNEINLNYKISKKDFSLIEVTHEVKQEIDKENYKSVGEFKLISLNDLNEISEAKNLK